MMTTPLLPPSSRPGRPGYTADGPAVAAAPSTAVAWRRALKAIGVELDGVRVGTIYNRATCRRADGSRYQVSEPVAKYTYPPNAATAQITKHAQRFADLVAASGWSADVVLRCPVGAVSPYIEITNGRRPHLREADRLLATTAKDDQP